MTAHEIFANQHLTHVRELKTEVARLNEELLRTHAELDALRSHFALALAAMRDADHLPVGGRLAIIDGWNALLGSASILTPEERHAEPSAKRERLDAIVQAWLAAHPLDAAWIVFDGARADGHVEGRLRVSFTGGTGPHRADRMVCDYLRMRRLSGAAHDVMVFTEDEDFRREAEVLGADVRPVGELKQS